MITGDRIRQARKAAGLSVKQLADKCGITAPLLTEWERGISAPNIDRLQDIADALSVSVDYLSGAAATTGDKIRSARKQMGFTLAELAERVGTIQQTIYKYEQGIVTNIPPDRVVKLAEALNVSPAYLLGWGADIEVDMGILRKYVPKLNDEGKAALIDYANYLLSNPKYCKENSHPSEPRKI